MQRQVYDVVFMDVQMPKWTDCKQKICELLSHKQRPYIVAMTAHAMAEDKGSVWPQEWMPTSRNRST